MGAERPPDRAGGPVMSGGAAGRAAASSSAVRNPIRAWRMAPALFRTPAIVRSQVRRIPSATGESPPTPALPRKGGGGK